VSGLVGVAPAEHSAAPSPQDLTSNSAPAIAPQLIGPVSSLPHLRRGGGAGAVRRGPPPASCASGSTGGIELSGSATMSRRYCRPVLDQERHAVGRPPGSAWPIGGPRRRRWRDRQPDRGAGLRLVVNSAPAIPGRGPGPRCGSIDSVGTRRHASPTAASVSTGRARTAAGCCPPL